VPTRAATGYGAATHVFLVPSQMAPILDAVEAGQLEWPAALKTVMLGAAPVLAPFLEGATRLLPRVDFHCIYGMTEVLPIAIAGGREKPEFASGRTAEFRTAGGAGEGDYLGEPLPGVQIRVAQDHELMASGPNMCLGYFGEDRMDEHATGDLVRMDHGPDGPDHSPEGPDGSRRGRLVMLGRKKDMIIRGKTNIYPGLYEPVIAGIEGVAQAVLIGIPDSIGDEAVWLAVEPRQGYGHEAVLRTLRRQLPLLIDETALPDRIEVMAKLPAVGRHRKPDRLALRALFADRETSAGGMSDGGMSDGGMSDGGSQRGSVP
jgi:acyl-CoA synthetase (AMP-forming)/AMP-acid ligase II